MEHTQWQELLSLGNRCFNNSQFSQAEFFYSEAYDILAYGYRSDPLSVTLLMAWICACHNLSYLYETTGDLDLSFKFLKVPYDYLTEISESNIPNEEVKLIAFQGLSITISPMLSFAKKYPMCEHCKAQLGPLKNLIDQQDKTIIH